MAVAALRAPRLGGIGPRLAYLRQRIRDLYEFRYLTRYLAKSALRVERVGFAFGFIWWLLDPLLLLAVYTIVIQVVLRAGVAGHYPYPLFLMSVVLPWELMSRAARNSIALTYAKERQMRQVAFPRAVIPLASMLAESVKFSIALVLFPFAALLFGQPLSPVQLLAVPLVPILMTFTVGVAWLLSSLNFVFRDTERLMTIAFRLWFLLCPIVYTLSKVPARFRGLYELNPLVPILQCFREVLLYHQIPGWNLVGEAVAAAVVVALIGFVVFHIYEPRFARLN